MTRISDLEAQIDALEARLGQSSAMVAEFDAELSRLGRNMTFTARETDALGRSLAGGLRRAFDGVVLDGARLQDALSGLGRTIAQQVYDAAMRPVQNAFGAALGRGLSGLMGSILPFAQGGAFSGGRVMPFANGGVVSQATPFPLRGGHMGVMGEAGPEAILPLARGADGKLGVAAGGGGGGVHVTFNIQTPDVAGFQRSQTQIAAQMNRLLAQGGRNR